MTELFSDDEEGVNGVQLTINEHYAKAFEYRKEREELEKLKAKYGSDYDPNTSGSDLPDSDSESAESEDEEGEELTPAVDAAILRTLARIKKKDPGIYDSSKNIFGEEQEKISSATGLTGVSTSKDKSKPIRLRQAKLDSLLQGSRSPSPSDDPRPLTHVEEQENLRKETIAAFHDAVTDVDGGDDFLIPRSKTKDELEQEEEEYRAFLEREVGDLTHLVTIDDLPSVAGKAPDSPSEEVLESKESKKKTKKSKQVIKPKKSKAEDDQEFLMNYILNRGWIDRSERHVPTYNEITVGSSKDIRKKKKKVKSEAGDDNSDLDALSEASFDSLASHFEASYNHRFEEPDAAVIPTYPRNLASTVRRGDTVRKDARERKKQRKEEDLVKKREEVRRLKALKMREVRRKLEVIGREAGLKSKGKAKMVADDEGDDGVVDEALKDLDLDGDWDPTKHDQQMAGLFERDDAFFEEEDHEDEADGGLDFDDEGKPVWDDDIDIGDIPMSDDGFDVDPKASKKAKKKELKKLKKQQQRLEDEEGVDMDAMYADMPLNQDFGEEEWDGTEEMRQRVLDKYMEEIYGLEFNDMVGDMPTRFRYVPTQPSSYALTPVEILTATDRELNEYMSVKKYAPYRLDKQDKHRYSKKNQEKLKELKGKIVERGGGRSGYGHGGANGAADDGDVKQKKRKGRKERMKLKATLGGIEVDPEQQIAVKEEIQPDVPSNQPSESKRPKKRKRDVSVVVDSVPPSRLPGAKHDSVHVADGEESKDGSKKKRKRKHKKDDNSGGGDLEVGF